MTRASLRRFAVPLAAWACALVLQACGGGGGGDTPAQPAGNTGGTQTVAPGVPVAVSAAASAVVQVAGSTAQVSLPANAFVAYDNPGQAISGQVNVAITPIAPSANPMAMAGGSYVARVPGSNTQTQQIESFGAITVDLTQGGQRVQLAPGQTATIRIPLDTRSSDRPATMPLYYWDETDKVWIQEGTATLKGDATSGFYYEGQVSHFSTWNADMPTESITVSGCLRDENGNKVGGSQIELVTDGVDYSGLGWGTVDNGKFTVPMKKDGRATLKLQDASGQYLDLQQDVGPFNADVTLPTCLVVKAKSLVQPTAAQAFISLLGVMEQAFELSQAAGSAVDVDTGSVMPAAQVCSLGTVTALQLNGNVVNEWANLTSGTDYTLTTSFAGCSPTQILLDDSATDKLLTGNTTAAFRYTQSDLGLISGSLSATLQQLTDSTEQLVGNGRFELTLEQSQAGNSITSTTTWSPQSGATMSHTLSGASLTATFSSGSLTESSVYTVGGEPPITTVSYNALTYTLGGAKYVLQGNLVDGMGQVSLSKNGSVISTLTITATSIAATGMVDPF
jgi:hypothetical protein